MQKLYKSDDIENVPALKSNEFKNKFISRDMKRKIQESCGDLPAIKQTGGTSPPNHSDFTMTSKSESPELTTSKKEPFSRKCTARKNLMENIFTRHSAVKRSYSFVAGEKLLHDGYFPHLSSSMDETSKDRNSFKNKMTKFSKNVPPDTLRRTRSEKDRKSAEKSQKSGQAIKKISLPEILMDISLSAKQQSRLERRTPENGEEGDNLVSDNLLDYLDKGITKEKIQTAKHRPITPGLIQELGRLRITSKQKAAQWVKSIPTNKKYFYGDNYLLGHPDLLTDHPGWIYSND